MPVLHKVAEVLLEKENIDGDEFERIFLVRAGRAPRRAERLCAGAAAAPLMRTGEGLIISARHLPLAIVNRRRRRSFTSRLTARAPRCRSSPPKRRSRRPRTRAAENAKRWMAVTPRRTLSTRRAVLRKRAQRLLRSRWRRRGFLCRRRLAGAPSPAFCAGGFPCQRGQRQRHAKVREQILYCRYCVRACLAD